MKLNYELGILVDRALLNNKITIEEVKRHNISKLFLSIGLQEWIELAKDRMVLAKDIILLNKLSYLELTKCITMLEVPNPADDRLLMYVHFDWNELRI